MNSEQESEGSPEGSGQEKLNSIPIAIGQKFAT